MMFPDSAQCKNTHHKKVSGHCLPTPGEQAMWNMFEEKDGECLREIKKGKYIYFLNRLNSSGALCEGRCCLCLLSLDGNNEPVRCSLKCFIWTCWVQTEDVESEAECWVEGWSDVILEIKNRTKLKGPRFTQQHELLLFNSMSPCRSAPNTAESTSMSHICRVTNIQQVSLGGRSLSQSSSLAVLVWNLVCLSRATCYPEMLGGAERSSRTWGLLCEDGDVGVTLSNPNTHTHTCENLRKNTFLFGLFSLSILWKKCFEVISFEKKL